MVPVMKLKMEKEAGIEWDRRRKLTDSVKAYQLVRELFEDLDREEFWVVALNAGCSPLAANKVSMGSLTQSLVHPREVIKFLCLAND